MSRLAPVVTFVVLLGSLAGCMSDDVTGPEVRPRLVLPPARVSFYSPPASFVAPATGEMIVRWTRSPADTQLNFKGYFIHLWQSHTGYDSTSKEYVTTWIKLVDSVHVKHVAGQLDTSYPFENIPLGEYTAVVWGEKATDTIGYSLDSTVSSNHIFDPRPLQNPTNVRATSEEGRVLLTWDLPPSDTNSGNLGYRVYYRLTEQKDSAHLASVMTIKSGVRKFEAGTATRKDLLLGAGEQPFQFWVKSVRVDSVMFYSDTNQIIWASSERLPHSQFDTSIHADSSSPNQGSYSLIKRSIFMGNQNGKWEMVEDSAGKDQQVYVAINGNSVVLTAGVGVTFSTQVDQAASLDSIFYQSPMISGFTSTSITLDPATDQFGRIIYLKLTDPVNTTLSDRTEWARLFIKHFNNGSFVNQVRGGIDVQASFQPGVTFAGTGHLPYY